MLTDDDGLPISLRAEDSAPPVAATEAVQPRRVRTALAGLDSVLLELQDDVEHLFRYVAASEGRATLRALYSGLEDAHGRVRRIVAAVERGA